jgi:hypothetical protein
MKRFPVYVLPFLLAVIFTSSVSHAQDVAAVTGVVSDTNGGLIVGADVKLVNTTTRAEYSGKTNSLGSYRIVNVTPGPGYKLTLTKGGFEPLVVTDIYLTVGTTRTQNAMLKPGSVRESVVVSAANSEVTLDTTDAQIGNNFDTNLLNELPVQVRDTPSSLFTLQPGITTSPSVPAKSISSTSSVTGARTDQSYVSVDGLDVNYISTGQTFLMVANAPVDSVEEFRGTVAGQLANSDPAGGGQFELVTKSGSNSWHGNVNEYHRDTSTAANDWFDDEAGVPLAHYVRNQFGGNLGGPIKKDKAFIFFNFFDLRLAHSVSEDTVVPTKSYSGGNISYVLANASDGSGACPTSVHPAAKCIGTLTPAQVKSLDPAGVGFSSVMQTLLSSRYGNLAGGSYDPTNGDGINTEGYRFNAPDPEDETNYVARFDYNIRPSMQLFAKFGMNRENTVEFLQVLPSDPVFANPFIDRSYDYVIGHTWTIGANKVNRFSYGDTVEKDNFPATFAPTGTTVLTLGDGVNSFLGDPYPEQETQKRRVPIPVVSDDFAWQKGRHGLDFGGSFKFIKTESQQIDDFNFLGLGLGAGLPGLDPTMRPDATTGYVTNSIRGGTIAPGLYDNAFALALGHIADVSTNYNYNASGAAYANGTGHLRRYRYYQTELYAADSWKVSRSLTLTYGLRYQYYSVPYETNGLESVENLDFDTYFADRVKQSAAGVSGPASVPFITYKLGGKANAGAPPLFQPNYKDFAPRASFAYNPEWASKTVFNGGAGIVYDRTVLNALNFIQDQSSYLFQNTVDNSNFGDLAGDPRVGTNYSFPGNTAPSITVPYTPNVYAGVPDGLTNNTYGFNSIIDPNLKDPYSILLNFGVQQQLGWGTILKVSYVGRMGRRLLAQADASQLIDFPDTSSGQKMSAAFANLTTAYRAGASTVANQPWFEDQVYPGATQDLYSDPYAASYISNGDFADFIQYVATYYGLDYNVGMASQFSENTFYTNKGSSSYNGLLVTMNKNLSHGLKFDVNYTWSHSIDNTSLIANRIASSYGTAFGFICDATRPRECRGNSDFDQTHVINGDFSYQVPIGRGKTFGGTAPRWVDAVVGGWTVSGIPQWHSGLAFTAFSNAYLAGFSNDAPAIFSGNRTAVAPHLHKQADGSVNLFTDSDAADAAYSGPVGFTVGSRNNLRGPSAWAFDAGVAKSFPLVADRATLNFRADAFNVLNHPTFALPDGTDITEESGTSFGQITATTGAPRVVQLAVRIEF